MTHLRHADPYICRMHLPPDAGLLDWSALGIVDFDGPATGSEVRPEQFGPSSGHISSSYERISVEPLGGPMVLGEGLGARLQRSRPSIVISGWIGARGPSLGSGDALGEVVALDTCEVAELEAMGHHVTLEPAA